MHALRFAPAFVSIRRGNLRFLLSGEKKLRPSADPRRDEAVTWRLESHSIAVSGIDAEAARLRAGGVKFRRDDIVSGHGGSQIWLLDPSGNLVELFQASKEWR